jgi:basic membrane protein A
LRIKSICLLAIVLLSLTACTQLPDCSRKDVFCAGLVTDTRGLNDFGSNQNTWAGLQQSHADGVVDQVAYIESVNPKDYEKNIAYFADSGYDVIVTSGIGLRDATLHNADLYPDSVFIGINQPDEDSSRPNFIPVLFPEDQMGFFAGALAVQLTNSKTVGAVCETSGIDAMWRYCEGFRAGAKYKDDSVKVLVVYRDGESNSKLFIDDAWGYENAQKLIKEADVDVLFAVGGETAVGALRAASESNIQTIGAERDQRAALGEEGSSVVTSVLGQTSSTVQVLMRSLRGGNLPDARMGPIGYVPFDRFVSKNVFQEMETVLTGLENGEIKTNIAPEKP